MENKFLYKSIESQLIKNFLETDNKKNFIEWINSKWNTLHYDKKETDANYRKYLEDQKIRKKGNDYTKKQYGNDYVNEIKLDPLTGKTFLNLEPHEFPEKFYKKAEEYAKKINPNCKLEYVSIVKYSAEFGEPALRPHFDSPTKAVFILDYQLDGNTTWPLVVNLEEYILKNNECLVFDNNLAIHWRVPQKFKKGEFLIMIFYIFTDENKEIPSLKGQPEEINKYFKVYVDKYNEIFGDDGKQSKIGYQTGKLADLLRWAKERDQLKNNDL